MTQDVDKMEDIFQAASLDITMTSNQFINYCNYFDFESIKTTNVMNEAQPNSSGYVPLKIPLRNQQKNGSKFFPNPIFVIQVQPSAF